MSLIQDALKRKTEEQHPQADAPPPMQPTPTKEMTPPPAQKPMMEMTLPDSSSKKLFIILSIAIVLILLTIGSSIYIFMSQPKTGEKWVEINVTEEPAAQPVAVAKITPAPAPAPVPAPKKKSKIKWPDLTFSGSAAGGHQILAIINGRMLAVGGRINGATVLKIGKNEVLIEFEGEKRILHVDDE